MPQTDRPTAAPPDRPSPSHPPSALADLARAAREHTMDAALPPAPEPDASAAPAALDPWQRAAFARALASPDVAVIEGEPGTGKSRVILELARHHLAAGRRVLLAAGDARALDTLLDALEPALQDQCARCLGAGERVESLPPTAQARLTGRVLDRHASQTLARLDARVRDAETRLAALDGAADAWDRWLAALADPPAAHAAERERLAAAAARLDADLAGLLEGTAPPEPHADDSAFARADRADRERREADDAEDARTLDALATERERLERAVAECRREAETLTASQDAKRSGRFWQGEFWKALVAGDNGPRLAELQSRAEAADNELMAVRKQIEAVEERRRRRAEGAPAERAARVAAEAARRRVALDARGAELQARAEAATRALADAHSRLTRAGVTPSRSAGRAEVEAARDAFALRRAAVAGDLAEARAARADAPSPASLRAERLAQVRLVAAPAGAGCPDGLLDAGRPFDAVLIDDAPNMPAADLFALAALGRSWVLAGRPAHAHAPDHHGEAHAGNGTAPRPEEHPFPLLARALSRRVWRRERGRLAAQLVRLSEHDRRHVEREPLADRPNCHIGLLVTGDEPALAEMTFPPGESLAQAKAYLLRESGEASLDPPETLPAWSVDDEGCEARWLPDTPEAARVELEGGAAETADERTLHTLAVRFPAGWGDADHARAWLSDQLARRGHRLNRHVRLARQHRQHPELAAWVADAMGGAADPAPTTSARVTFLCVPPPAVVLERERDRERGGPRSTGRPGATVAEPLPQVVDALRCGMGLDTDLADPRQRDRLPPDLASKLPVRGFVNLPEARAIAEWVTGQTGEGTVVTALYESQAALLRAVLFGPRAYGPGRARVEVLAPADALRRECDHLVLSLTRSHPARAVTYGENPDWLPELARRPRSRLTLVGDPGGIARRARWEHAIDPFDAHHSRLERRRLTALVEYLAGRGHLPEAFKLEEWRR